MPHKLVKELQVLVNMPHRLATHRELRILATQLQKALQGKVVVDREDLIELIYQSRLSLGKGAKGFADYCEKTYLPKEPTKTCTKCEGNGRWMVVGALETHGKWEICPDCKGTGKVND